MIWDSTFWQEDLLKQAAGLVRRRTQRRWSERSLARLEQSVMLGFYSIRKLIEAKKLTDSAVTTEVPVVGYPAKGKPVTHLNWHLIDQLYDLEAPTRGWVRLEHLCNQFVHSYIFMPDFDELGSLSAIYIASDWTRAEKVLEILIEELVRLFTLVGNDRASGGAMVYNAKRRDYDVILCNPMASGASDAGEPSQQAANQPTAPGGWRRR